MITKEILLSLISEEKDNYNKYVTSCANYQIQPDALATARSHGRLEILQRLVQEKSLPKI
jgi:hypothetical protein